MLLYVVAFAGGVVLGRWYERYRLYDRLLGSNKHSDWETAHRLRAIKEPKTTAAEALGKEEESDFYAPTPTRLRALRPLAPTVRIERDSQTSATDSEPRP